MLCITLALSTALTAHAQRGADRGEWHSYGGDLGSTKYSPLDQINADNVSELKIAWVWHSPDNDLIGDNRRLVPGAFKSTPLMVDGVLYVPTMLNIVAAIDAGTGETLWTFDTEVRKGHRPANLGFNHRGVAFWKDGNRSRVFFNANDARLWSLDARTGSVDPAFGVEGRLDLTEGMRRAVNRRFYLQTSPPLVVADRLIVGSAVFDVPTSTSTPPGDVRAFDPRTGEQVWNFETIPQAGSPGNETWEDGSWAYTGSANVWTLMSADPELGYLYLPTSTPTNDWYGGHRLGDNLYAESLVCVDAATGERVWHYQFVHHGLWDYDLPAAPVLCDITVDGKEIKAVAQITKQGFTFVFDRVTGEPLWPIEEKPVPQSTVPGERTSPTQPHPTKPEPFEPQGVTQDDLIDFTPEIFAEAVEIMEKYDHGPLFSPPSLRGVISRPGWGGGGNWQGSAFDPDTDMLYIPSWLGMMVVQLVKPDPNRSNFRYVRGGAWDVQGPRGLPLTKPPFGRITAINLRTGENVWMRPHGDGIRKQIVAMGLPDPGPVGGGDTTGPVLTKTLLFIAQGGTEGAGASGLANAEDMMVNMELGEVHIEFGERTQLPPPEPTPHYLRAYDKATGDLIHQIELPYRPSGTPMTYMSKGKQYIVLAGGGGKSAHLMALALP